MKQWAKSWKRNHDVNDALHAPQLTHKLGTPAQLCFGKKLIVKISIQSKELYHIAFTGVNKLCSNSFRNHTHKTYFPIQIHEKNDMHMCLFNREENRVL